MPVRSRRQFELPRRRAIAISMRERARFPYRTYGRAHFQRGTPDNLARFGATFRSATPEQQQWRRTVGYTGRGRYNVNKFVRNARHLLGNRVMGAVSRRAANEITNFSPMSMAAAGYTGMGLYNGRGSYTVNNLISDPSSTETNAIPQMISLGDETGAVQITHKEYLTDVYGPGEAGGPAVPFENTSYALNPGVQRSFTWLSQIAQNFDEYEFKQLVYHYRSTTTSIGNSSTGQVGTVVMCTNYNAAEDPFTDKQAMLQYAHAMSTKATNNMSHGVECDPNKNALGGKLYVRTDNVTPQDLKTYDMGKFQIAVANSPVEYNGFPLGELWVEYTVECRKPKLYASRGLDIDGDVFTHTTPNSSALPFGAGSGTLLLGENNNIGCLIEPVSVGTEQGNGFNIVFPASYTGILEIILNIAPRIPDFEGDIPANWIITGVEGNVGLKTDILGAGGSGGAGGWISTTGNVLQGVSSARPVFNSTVWVCHCFVQQSTSGVDNKLLVRQNPSSNVAVVAVQCWAMLTVRQYQSNGKLDNTATKFVNSQSNTLTEAPWNTNT